MTTFSYWKFGSTAFPNAANTHDLSTGTARQPVINTPNGTYTPILTAKLFGASTIQISFSIYSTSDTGLSTAEFVWRNLVGTRALLYRYRPEQAWASENTYATMIDLRTVRSPSHKMHLDLTATFVLENSLWVGANISVLTTLNVTPKTVAYVNAGGLAALPTITLDCNTANITSFQITGTGIDMTYSATVLVGNLLVINCATMSIKNNGVADYANWDRHGTNHTIDGWVHIPTAGISLTYTFAGGGVDSTVTVAYDERFL